MRTKMSMAMKMGMRSKTDLKTFWPRIYFPRPYLITGEEEWSIYHIDQARCQGPLPHKNTLLAYGLLVVWNGKYYNGLFWMFSNYRFAESPWFHSQITCTKMNYSIRKTISYQTYPYHVHACIRSLTFHCDNSSQERDSTKGHFI